MTWRAGALLNRCGHLPSPTSTEDEETLLAEPQRSRFTARLDMRRPVSHGEALDLWFDATHLYLFDPVTGESLAAGEAALAAAGAPAERVAATVG